MDEVQQVEPLATCRASTVSLHVPFPLVLPDTVKPWIMHGLMSGDHPGAPHNFLGSVNLLLDGQHGFFACGNCVTAGP